MILLSRTRFFLFFFLLLAGPLLAPRLLWLAGSRHTTGTMAFVGHDGLGSTLGISTYPVIFFRLGKDSIFFNGMQGYGYKPGDRVPVRYSLNHPDDARIDQPLSLWGQTAVNLLLPVFIWLVILLTPARFDPLVPRGCRLLVQWKKPFVKVLLPVG
jgi:hypothetical protein